MQSTAKLSELTKLTGVRSAGLTCWPQVPSGIDIYIHIDIDINIDIYIHIDIDISECVNETLTYSPTSKKLHYTDLSCFTGRNCQIQYGGNVAVSYRIVSLTYRIVDVSFRWRIVLLTYRIVDVSYRWRIVSLMYRFVDVSYRWRIVSLTYRIVDVSFRWRIISLTYHIVDVSYCWRIVLLMYRFVDVSYGCVWNSILYTTYSMCVLSFNILLSE